MLHPYLPWSLTTVEWLGGASKSSNIFKGRGFRAPEPPSGIHSYCQHKSRCAPSTPREACKPCEGWEAPHESSTPLRGRKERPWKGLATREAVQPGFLINWLVVGLARRTILFPWSWSWTWMAETLDVNGVLGVNKWMLIRYARWHAGSGEKATISLLDDRTPYWTTPYWTTTHRPTLHWTTLPITPTQQPFPTSIHPLSHRAWTDTQSPPPKVLGGAARPPLFPLLFPLRRTVFIDSVSHVSFPSLQSFLMGCTLDCAVSGWLVGSGIGVLAG